MADQPRSKSEVLTEIRTLIRAADSALRLPSTDWFGNERDAGYYLIPCETWALLVEAAK